MLNFNRIYFFTRFEVRVRILVFGLIYTNIPIHPDLKIHIINTFYIIILLCIKNMDNGAGLISAVHSAENTWE